MGLTTAGKETPKLSNQLKSNCPKHLPLGFTLRTLSTERRGRGPIVMQNKTKNSSSVINNTYFGLREGLPGSRQDGSDAPYAFAQARRPFVHRLPYHSTIPSVGRPPALRADVSCVTNFTLRVVVVITNKK